MKTTPVKNVDDYIALQPQEVRIALEKLRTAIKQAAPKAEETIGYGMPAYKLNGPLVYFAAFKNHFSFFPGNGKLVDELKMELKGVKTSKGTIQFTLERLLPVTLVKKIVKLRMKENLERKKK